VLISLLLRTGRTVPAEVLIDQVWGEYLPSNPANALQVHVSYLRRALGLPTDGHVPALRTVAGGYVLDVAPESIDLFRFERLVAPAGRHHPVGGRPAR
jgi:DNA-binding response OmpR family regulator